MTTIVSGEADRESARFAIQLIGKRARMSRRAVVAQRSLEFARGGERTYIHFQSPQRRVRGCGELKSRADLGKPYAQTPVVVFVSDDDHGTRGAIQADCPKKFPGHDAR